MAESALFKSYQATENARIERELDEALGRLDAVEASEPEPAVEPASPATAASSSPSDRRSAGPLIPSKRGREGVYTFGPDTREHIPEFLRQKDGIWQDAEGNPPYPLGADLVDGLVRQASRSLGVVESIKRRAQGIADWIAPADRSEQNMPGIMGSIRRGIAAIPDRMGQGVQELSEGLDALSNSIMSGERALSDLILDKPAASGMDRLKQGGSGALQVLIGLTNVVFPFSAFAGEVGGDFHEWLAKSSGELTDEKLQAAREFAKQHAPGTVSAYDALLAIPYEQRVAQARAAGSIGSEVLSGIIPGYVSPVSVARPKPATR
jgi:hypothetical protein